MFSVRSLILLALPLLAAARAVELDPRLSGLPDLPSQIGYSPLEALEHGFRAVHDAHRARKVAAAEEEELQALGDRDGILGAITTRNELIEGRCKPIIIIFGRGTTEPGNVGDDVGPLFFIELEKLEPGRVLIQGVNNYRASVWEYLTGGSESGAKDMAASAKRAAVQCPDSKIVLSGFSQGAQVTHKAAKLLSPSLHSRIGAIVLFGDPDKGKPFPGTLNRNVKTFCHDGDLICSGIPIPLDQHSNYEDDSPEAAKYVADRL